ncbi:alpha beta hydrolase superfamily protein [Lactobacillus selangorensis]|uniref:Alpha beta hydrolase superfamily protein n=1 Tax=Lactobacillus selangorensis TaxID=81857 RepID=A0A0R2FHA6_9LACO|nr:alpha/beta hydrolase [Lactobacillus selangorensis]KRN28015.1 alpha beta hydrolase superfamily protein [Lactobacillus selangorensis]KRN30514.1 alpha beta hydrolase superfamily protein [Lactobacillus selangorensis]
MIRKHWRLILGILASCIIALGIIIPAYQWMHENVSYARVQHNSRMDPIIFIPGSSATQERFNALATELNKGSSTKHSLLKVTVQENDTLKYSGRIRPNDTQPFIVVAFQNNKDGYSNIKKQARWFSIAMNALIDTYQFNHFSGVGHSNGGLIYTLYLEKYLDQSDVTINRLMTIGSPYNFNETSLQNHTQMLNDFIKGSSNLPKDLIVYSIAGTEDYASDGIVPYQSVEAGKYIYQNKVKQYTEITVTGADATHSDLTQSKQTVQLIRQDILRQSNKKNGTDNNNDDD